MDNSISGGELFQTILFNKVTSFYIQIISVSADECLTVNTGHFPLLFHNATDYNDYCIEFVHIASFCDILFCLSCNKQSKMVKNKFEMYSNYQLRLPVISRIKLQTNSQENVFHDWVQI